MLVLIVMNIRLLTGVHRTVFQILLILWLVLPVLTVLNVKVWYRARHSISTSIRRPTDQVVADLGRALTEEGLGYVLRSTQGDARMYRWSEVFELADGMTLSIMETLRTTDVYLGPVGKDNNKAVESLKAVVERAAGMAR